MRILVIDNDQSFGPVVRDVMSKYFEEILVTQLPECPQIIDASTMVGVDVAMIDTEMVDREGLECMRRIRGGNKYLPVVMLADHSNADFTRECIDAGADDYIMKENVPRMLGDTVKSAIERRNKTVHVETEVERRGLRLETLKDRIDQGTWPSVERRKQRTR